MIFTPLEKPKLVIIFKYLGRFVFLIFKTFHIYAQIWLVFIFGALSLKNLKIKLFQIGQIIGNIW